MNSWCSHMSIVGKIYASPTWHFCPECGAKRPEPEPPRLLSVKLKIAWEKGNHSFCVMSGETLKHFEEIVNQITKAYSADTNGNVWMRRDELLKAMRESI